MVVVGSTPESVCVWLPPCTHVLYFRALGSLPVTDQFCVKGLKGGLRTCHSDSDDLAPRVQEGAVQQQCAGVTVKES